MKQLMILAAVVMLAVPAMADTFGTGDNQFTIDFVPISGDASSANGTHVGGGTGHFMYREFTDPGNNYRISKFQITNSQWATFEDETGLSLGSSHFAGNNIPVNQRNWYQAAQFVNWLNTSNNYQPAYNFEDGSFKLWDESLAEPGTNLRRHKSAFYFLPTEDQWVKAAYWNGIALQTNATKDGSSPIPGTDSNYYFPNPEGSPWNVGSGSEELNGTFDMMGNVWEWVESPGRTDLYSGLRGGAYYHIGGEWQLDHRHDWPNDGEYYSVGFRVASIPEPTTLLLLGMGGLLMRKITGSIDKK